MAKEPSVLELVEAFNKAQADLADAQENSTRLEAEIRRLTPFEQEATELRERLADAEELSELRSQLGNQYGSERDAAVKDLDVAQAALREAQEAADEARNRAEEAEVEVENLRADLKVAEGEIRQLRAFEAKARPIFEAADALRAVLK